MRKHAGMEEPMSNSSSLGVGQRRRQRGEHVVQNDLD